MAVTPRSLEIGQAIDHALKIAAMVVKLVPTIVDAAGLQWIVVGPVAVTEAVDHDEVHHVRRRETLEPAGAVERRQNFERRVHDAVRGCNC